MGAGGRSQACHQATAAVVLSSMRGERDVDVIQERGVSGPEKVVAVCCATALIAFEVWFFFFSGSSLPAS